MSKPVRPRPAEKVISIVWYSICFSKCKEKYSQPPYHKLEYTMRAEDRSRSTSCFDQLFGKPLGLADEWAVTCAAALNHIE